MEAGVLADGGCLYDYQLATSVQVDGALGRIITSDPFPATREYLGGWYIVDVPELDAALEWGLAIRARSAGASRSVP